jgi:hypothetical protein
MRKWLNDYGKGDYGWTKAKSPKDAQAHANMGKPTIVIGTDEEGINRGHIAIVRPGNLDPELGPSTAQAGVKNLNKGHVYEGSTKEEPVEYWVHE